MKKKKEEFLNDPKSREKERRDMSFQYIQPTEKQVETMQNFRDKYEALAEEIKQLPDGRGKSLAVTKLEESAMWLNKAITLND